MAVYSPPTDLLPVFNSKMYLNLQQTVGIGFKVWSFQQNITCVNTTVNVVQTNTSGGSMAFPPGQYLIYWTDTSGSGYVGGNFKGSAVVTIDSGTYSQTTTNLSGNCYTSTGAVDAATCGLVFLDGTTGTIEFYNKNANQTDPGPPPVYGNVYTNFTVYKYM